jgi:heme-degrading monooxygenase HmoA
MWAQLLKFQVKPGSADEMERIYREVDAQTGPETGWGRSYSLRNRKNPDEVYALVIFESEAKAREYEHSPEQAKLTSRTGELMVGTPEFVDFDLVTEYAP